MIAAPPRSKPKSPRFQIPVLLGATLLLAGQHAWAAEFYVSPTGVDSNPGTMTQPFASIQKGHDAAAAGDTVWIRGGTYEIVKGASSVSGIAISKSGESDAKRIKFWAMPGEVPIVDFSDWQSSASAKANGIHVTGSWLHIKGLEIANLPQAGTYTNSGLLTGGASNNIFELLNIHHIGGPGLFISGGNGGNLIVNCDAHDNYDAKSSQGAGENADGFGVHYQSSGPSTVIRGCRAWWNADDGYDLISQEVPVTIDGSWAMANGFIDSGMTGKGNGNGFKAGSSKDGIRHLIKNSVAWKNRAAGFYANHSSCGNTWLNNTSYDNGTQYDMLASTWDAAGNRTDGVTLTGAKAHIMRNNLGFPNDNSNMQGVDTSFNTWDLNIVPAASDFISVSDTGAMGPRSSDGALPVLSFMKLSSSSKLIDKGTDVGIAATGVAPDLGAYEYGAVTPIGTGGSSTGTGGSSTGTGGAPGTGGLNGMGGSTSAGTGGNGAGGGAPGSGGQAGVPGSSGAPGTAGTDSPPAATGGSSASGGMSGSAGGEAEPAPSDSPSSGCSCRLQGHGARGVAAWPLLALSFLSLAWRRRGRVGTARTSPCRAQPAPGEHGLWGKSAARSGRSPRAPTDGGSPA